MAVRSDYIKKLMNSKNSLEKQYEEVLKESMKNIIGENAKEEVRKLLKEAEDEDSFTEEEVNDDTASNDNDEVIDTEETVTDDTSDVTTDDTTDDEATSDGVDNVEDATEIEDDVEDDLWKDLENCKSADGEYDCREMDDDSLIKIVKVMGPEDGIRVMSNEDGTVTVEVDGDLIDGSQEFIIDFDDDKFDDDFNDQIEESKNSNTGYTSNYQKETAMTTPDNHEPANPKTTYSMDAGVPKGTEKPFANQGDTQPYNDEVNECDETIYEIEGDDEEEMIEEVMTSTENNPTVRGTSMTHANTNSSHKFARNGHVGGESPTNMRNGRGTGDGYKEATNETIEFKKKMNKLYEENKQMKSIIPELNKKLMESMVINSSMGYIVRLLNENATSIDEKKAISERFGKVTTLEESKKLYETISDELKKSGNRKSVNEIFNSQIAEGKQKKQNLVETTMYKSEKVNDTLDFMKRLDNIK